MKLAIKCKLLPNKEQHQELLNVMKTFNLACDWVSQKAFETKTFNKVNLHKIVYYEIKQRFNLSSQLAIRVIGKVTDCYKNWRQKDKILSFRELGSIDYDSRNLTIKKDESMSIMGMGKRIKLQYCCKKSLKFFDLSCQSELSYDRIKNKFYIIFFSETSEEVPIQTTEFLGVDLGIVNLATTSHGEIFTGEKVEKYRKKITSLKSRLQSKGTKSAKRHLKKISKKETLFKKDVNHCISKKLVSKAKALGLGLKLEDLKFKNKKPVMKFNKELRDKNAIHAKWAFGQLKNFITYKAKLAGIPVLMVNPAYTSQKCNKCGHTRKENRLTQNEFKCIQCGYTANADYNASINISRAEINKPIVDICKSDLQTNSL
jgi:IS605 OrfB family transposase